MENKEIDVNKTLEHYGFDSILLMQLLHQLQTQIDPFVDLARLRECKTTQDIINILQQRNKNSLLISQSANKH